MNEDKHDDRHDDEPEFWVLAFGKGPEPMDETDTAEELSAYGHLFRRWRTKTRRKLIKEADSLALNVAGLIGNWDSKEEAFRKQVKGIGLGSLALIATDGTALNTATDEIDDMLYDLEGLDGDESGRIASSLVMSRFVRLVAILTKKHIRFQKMLWPDGGNPEDGEK